MKNRCFRALYLVVFVCLFTLSSSLFSVEAQGCSISSFTMTPEGTVPLGTHVVLSGTSNCGTVRFTVNGEPRAEIGSSNQTETLRTEEFGTGGYEVCFVARGTGGWENAARTCKSLYIQGSQGAPPNSNPGTNVRCWVNQFTVTPSTIPFGGTAQFAGYGQCDGNARAARFYIDSQPWGEFGGNTTSASWNTSGYSSGSHQICFGITAGEWSQEARSCTSVTIAAPQVTPTPAVAQGSQADNGQPGQTGQSGAGGVYNPTQPPAPPQQPNNSSPSNNSNSANSGSGNSGGTSGNSNPPPVSGSGQLPVVGYQYAPSGEYVCVATARLNVRSGPGVNNPAIAQSPQGACFNYLGSDSATGWYNISWGSGSGWVANGSSYTRRGNSGSSAGVGSSGNSGISNSGSISNGRCGTTANLNVGGQGRVTEGLPNRLRSSPEVRGDNQVGTMLGGSIFSVVGGPQCNGGYQWWQVSYNGTTAWTASGSDGQVWLIPMGSSQYGRGCSRNSDGSVTCVAIGVFSPSIRNDLLGYLRDPYAGIFEIPRGSAANVLSITFTGSRGTTLSGEVVCGVYPGERFSAQQGFELILGCVHAIDRAGILERRDEPTNWQLTYRP